MTTSTTMTTTALLTPAAAADYVAQKYGLRVTPGTVRRWCRKGAIPALAGRRGHLFIRTSDLDAAFRR